ncbi:YybH family protein [Streptomyces montanisoli]|uniref:Nuclear transport factor 2 family protein n=1 Tax=Streptomyces montanisoli TaxID=2798581 RepID=A0A940M9U1_9ACTN|nr:nuclear transport factor 2 family protein [Streptomyces montanisoli]MBP0457003.1 nuclear transport factor 2 family protein [Streptomyces montanisoli]
MATMISTALDLSAAFDSRLNDGDLPRLMELLADTAVSRTPQGDVLTDRKAIEADLAGMITAKAVLHNTPRVVLEADDVALLLIDWVLEIDTPTGRADLAGTTANIARRDETGSWRLAVLNPGGTN